MKLYAAAIVTMLLGTACSGGGQAEEPVQPDEQPAAEEEASDTSINAPGEDDTAIADVEEVTEGSSPTLAAEPAGFDGTQVSKYVTSFALNVRSAPDKDNSSVIRHVKWGDKVDVIINGEWAKLGSGEYISSKHLSDADPALKHSKSKAKPKGKKGT